MSSFDKWCKDNQIEGQHKAELLQFFVKKNIDSQPEKWDKAHLEFHAESGTQAFKEMIERRFNESLDELIKLLNDDFINRSIKNNPKWS